MHISKWLVCLGLLLPSSLHAGEFQAGVARIAITPPVPFWLTGYAARTRPAETVRMELWAKALAIQDDRGGRVVIITTDLIGLPREISGTVAQRLARDHGLRRSEVLFSSSHTHSGPVIWPNLRVLFDFDETEMARVRDYSAGLTDALATVAAQAMANLSPAQLSWGQDTADFAINRREPTAAGFRIGVSPGGPTDHSVPVLRIAGMDGTLRVVVFGYACHNTTLGGDFYEVHGDYAGIAQLELEKSHPGATAMFLSLCGGDQNPNPRGTRELVEQHGRSLAAAVERALGGDLQNIRPPLETAYHVVNLEFAPQSRLAFLAEAIEGDKYPLRRALLILEAHEQGRPIQYLSYPLQAVRFNDNFTLLAMGGEVVLDYALRARRQFPGENLIVAAYCNDVSCYIPSVRILHEGGYEAVDSMIYYGLPGPFTEDVEETVFEGISDLLSRSAAK